MFERPSSADRPPRYGLIDAVRGFAVLNMIVYHLCYDLFCIYSLDAAFDLRTPVIIWEHLICCTFILISGVSMNFTRSAYRRGLYALLGGFLITAVTLLLIPGEVIWFGVLSFLGCAMILTRLLQRLLDKLPPLPGAVGSFLLFAFLYDLPGGSLGFFGLRLIELPSVLYECKYLAFLGLPSKGFYSADYFPILPWLFLFLCGYFLWRFIAARGRDGAFVRRIPVLDFIGRHSFVIYLLHQPVLLGICFLIFGHF